MMEDVSLGARVLLAKHKYAGWRDKWRANHPYLEAHPEEGPSWLRKQAARNWGKPARGKELIETGLPVVATSEAALDARAREEQAEAEAAAAEVKEGNLPELSEQYKRAFSALLTAPP